MSKQKSEKPEEQLMGLRQHRDTMERNLKSITTKIEQDMQGDLAVVECRAEILEAYFQQICQLQTQIERIDPADETRGEIEDLFVAARAMIAKRVGKGEKVKLDDSSAFNVTNYSKILHQNRLPPLKLPKFDGKYGEYNRFITSFKNLVHDDESIPTIDKFNYLLSSLSGNALNVVAPFQVSAENYAKALQQLAERYDKRVLIFLEHITSLFNIQTMPRSDPSALRTLLDTVSALRGSLLSLGSEADVMNAIIIQLVLSNVDLESKLTYDRKQNFEKLPSWEFCYDTLSRHCQFLESNTKPQHDRGKGAQHKQSSSSFVTAQSKSTLACSKCQSTDHHLASCPQFLPLSVGDRYKLVKQLNLCLNCLRKGHMISKCPSKSRCRICQNSHHTALHRHISADNNGPHTVETNALQPPVSSLVSQSSRRALIPTALVLIKDKYGSFQTARALLDSCSEINFITEELAKHLQLGFQRNNQEISGIADVRTNLRFSVKTAIKSRVSGYEFTSDLAVTKRISLHQPEHCLDTTNWNLPGGIELADPLFFRPQKIDLLLGSQIFFDIFIGNNLTLGKDSPRLINTTLGWVVGGRLGNNVRSNLYTCNIARCHGLDTILNKFWELEDFTNDQVKIAMYTPEEQECENHFKDHAKVLANGRIQVSLPFKQSPNLLGESIDLAKRRFLQLERRLERDAALKEMYSAFMQEYLDLGHMSPIHNLELTSPHYVIPHHCVIRPESSTTKLRVVFDASAQTTAHCSLNDLVMVGPTIQQNLILTLLAFRLHRYGLSADICKMYRQFVIEPQDRKYQLIYWRTSVNDPLSLFQLNTVTYGMACAPFLAIRSLHLVAELHKDKFPIGSATVQTDMYVDDLLTGADDINDLHIKAVEITKLLAEAGLQLAKWKCSQRDLRADSEELQIRLEEMDVTKALGMSWKPQDDVFCFNYDLPVKEHPTKRSVVSTVARLYDILGLVSPVIVRCKIFVQELWIRRIGWDEVLPNELSSHWKQIEADLQHLNYIEVPRYVQSALTYKCDVHGFADASQRAYGCCIYLSANINGQFTTSLLISKSKVAPIKAVSLPRLELCAAVLLCSTWSKIKPKLVQYVNEIYFWTDSSIVLQWIRMHSSTLNCFVANRVSELQDKSVGINWRHVPTKQNPADIVSRGCMARELLNTMWFKGPTFLSSDPESWPKDTTNISLSKPELEQRKQTNLKCSVGVPDDNIIEKVIANYSSYRRIVRMMAFILRPFNKIAPSKNSSHNFEFVSPDEFQQSFLYIVSFIQHTQYAHEIKLLKAGKTLTPELQKLAPFLVETPLQVSTKFVLRVGGRLNQAPIEYNAKFPVLLPKQHQFTRKFVEHLHLTNKHAGPKVLIGIMRLQVWVINARELVRKVVNSCVHCYHYKPKLVQQIMGSLPADRLLAHRPFLVVGVDLCGPFFTSYRIRGKAPYKTRPVAAESIQASVFQGLWEAAVKSMKTLLLKNISQSNLTFEELQTVMIEVEAILNSRPLTPLTNDPNDGEALTPAHLLIGTSLKTLPEPQLTAIKESRLTSWQRITYLKQRLWDLWRRDYLHTLQVRSKWLRTQENIIPGQLVIVHDDNLPPQQSTLGRITNTFPGADGRVRVVDIFTKRGTLRRPVHKIAPLPIE